jgi:glycosyltransferase involved in cell wall biosynthesis
VLFEVQKQPFIFSARRQRPLNMANKIMKIIFSNYDDIKNPFYGGGGAIAIHEVAKRLSARHYVTVITGKYPGAQDGVVDGVNYERIGYCENRPKLGQILFHAALIREVKRRTFDVWVENSTPPFSTTCLQRFTKTPVVFLAMNLSGRDMAAKYHVPMYLFENLGLKTYRHAIGVTETMRREMLKTNPKLRVEVISNGLDQAIMDQPLNSEEDYILFLGRIDIRHKGLDLLLEAYKTVESEITVPLVIAGAGLKKDEAWLKARIAALKLDSRVRCIGKVAGKTKEDTFRRAMLYVAPSRCEGVPLAIMEALGYGLPTVIFDIDDLAWMPNTHCIKAVPFDVAEYGQEMLKLTRDQSRRQTLGRLAKEWIRAYSWDAIAIRYENFLNNAIAA